MLRFARVSILTGRTNEMDLPVTVEQVREWTAGAAIQEVMPHLSPEEREFLINGVTPSEWDAMIGGEE